MTTESAPIDMTAAQIQDVRRLNEAITEALSEARSMANRAELGPHFTELLMHVGELHDLMNETLAQFDPAEVQPLLAISAQMRSATRALQLKVAN